MCRQIAEGTRWRTCGHFQRHLVVAIMDCNKASCTKSIRHPASCRLPTCIQNFGPDVQKDIDAVDDFCWTCKSAQERASRNAR